MGTHKQIKAIQTHTIQTMTIIGEWARLYDIRTQQSLFVHSAANNANARRLCEE